MAIRFPPIASHRFGRAAEPRPARCRAQRRSPWIAHWHESLRTTHAGPASREIILLESYHGNHTAFDQGSGDPAQRHPRFPCLGTWHGVHRRGDSGRSSTASGGVFPGNRDPRGCGRFAIETEGFDTRPDSRRDCPGTKATSCSPSILTYWFAC